MQFRTQIGFSKNTHPINYDSTVISIGSCFAVNIAQKFNYYKFQNTVNPFGILFHPLAIQTIIRRAIEEDFFAENELFFYNERWHCFDVHSDLSNANKKDLLENLNQSLLDFKSQIKAASHLIITYGTAWVYKEKASQKIVANCHKVPQAQFDKELLTAAQIEAAIIDTISLLLKVNPNLNIVLTISPVRHIKDGFIQNQQSKANLIISVHQAIHQTNNHQPTTINYFPSYEIMMDELRDYRFYADDLLHPSQMAIDYIWQRFSETTISTESHSIMQEVDNIQKGLAHRPFNPETTSHQEFSKNLIKKMNTLASKFPQIQF